MEHEEDAVLGSLNELVAVGRENIMSWMALMARVDLVRELRRRGVRYSEMSLSDGVPVINAITANQARLTTAAARFRRVTARELHSEGVSLAAIARSFGVSRQRIAHLLTCDEAETQDGDGQREDHAATSRTRRSRPSKSPGLL